MLDALTYQELLKTLKVILNDVGLKMHSLAHYDPALILLRDQQLKMTEYFQLRLLIACLKKYKCNNNSGVAFRRLQSGNHIPPPYLISGYLGSRKLNKVTYLEMDTKGKVESRAKSKY